ncbi:MAG TPA: hypothetical protein VFY60_09010 [Pyrinomonadaceae bacterium]|nr:hypothetical protein [Pyrinomonadaceae bacterium]
MANKSLFKSFVGPATDALNEEQAPAYALSPKRNWRSTLRQVAALISEKLVVHADLDPAS